VRDVDFTFGGNVYWRGTFPVELDALRRALIILSFRRQMFNLPILRHPLSLYLFRFILAQYLRRRLLISRLRCLRILSLLCLFPSIRLLLFMNCPILNLYIFILVLTTYRLEVADCVHLCVRFSVEVLIIFLFF